MPSHQKKLSLQQAILVNVNIMLGAGIFINTVELAREAGTLGFLSYIIIGTMILPLIFSIAQLISLYPEGGFYTFGAQALHPFAGFISAWSYFTGKLASAVLMIHASILLLQQIIPFLQQVSPLVLDSGVLVTYMLLNLLHTETGATIQKWFIAVKLVPLIFVIFFGLFLFDSSNMAAADQVWSGLPLTLPLVLYATLGFEATCSLSSKIKNAAYNGPKAIFISYFTVLCIAIVYQFFFYGSVGSILGIQTNYLDAFPLFLSKLFTAPALIKKAKVIINLMIASSALGGAYGILYSNIWNLYTLAQKECLFASQSITQLNKYHIPRLAVFIEGAIGFLYLFVTQGSQLPLQQTGALGVTIAYTISALSLVATLFATARLSKKLITPLLALCSCTILIISCLKSFLLSGFSTLLIFLALLLSGIAMFVTKRKSFPTPK